MAKEYLPFGAIGERVGRLMSRLGLRAVESSISLRPEVRHFVAPPDVVWSREDHEGWEVVAPAIQPQPMRRIDLPAGAVLTASGWQSYIDRPGVETTKISYHTDPTEWMRPGSENIPGPDALGVRPDPQNWGTIVPHDHL